MNAVLHHDERRLHARSPAAHVAHLTRWPAGPEARGEPALLEDTGPTGFRIRSGLEFRPHEILRVVLFGTTRPLFGRVVWTRRDGLIEKGPARQVGAAFLAGCATLEGPPERRGSALELLGDVARGLGWACFLSLLLGLMISAGYLLVALVRLFGK